MAYLKIFFLSISIFIGLMHGPVHVTCQIFPPSPGEGPTNNFPSSDRPGPIPAPVPDLDRRSEETLTIILVEDSRLRNGDEFDSVFGGGFDRGLQNSVRFDGGSGGGFGGGFGSILALLFITFL